VSDDGWYRDPTFDEVAMADFETRLARARAHNRPQYLRIKGSALIQAEDPAAQAVGLGLLQRVLVEDTGSVINIPIAHDVLGDYYRRRGELDRAIDEYKAAIATATRGEVRSGGTGIEELDIAEVLIQRGAPDDYEAAERLLRSDQLVGQRHFNRTIFRIHVAHARVDTKLGRDPRDAASRALAIAEMDEPQFPRHPDVGLVEADDATLSEMRAFATFEA
jgi:tetratricopeptide (TPR) repeat protein